MTSGNLSDEPIAHDDEDAARRLGGLVDGLLTHDRPIHIRCDDSVVRAVPGRLQVLRRSRGYAPEPVPLPFTAHRPVLAVGAELKSTVSVAKGDVVVPSHHIGDLEHLATHRSFLQALDHLCDLYGVVPEVVAHDLHPEYLSTKLALELDLPAVGVQHHHAHVAACLVEHGRTEPVVGLAFDGLGYGPDGTMWGGEVLLAELSGYERVGHLVPVAMPGGVAAIREPWRMAAVWLDRAVGPAAVERALADVDPTVRGAVLDLAHRPATLRTTSIGRLFDAVASLLGGRRRVSYEAQAAIELEALARTVDRRDAPAYDGHRRPCSTARTARSSSTRPRWSPGWRPSGERGAPPAEVAAGFHEAIGRAAAALAIAVAGRRGLDTVALTGGVFQNVRLTEVVDEVLAEAGLHRPRPPHAAPERRRHQRRPGRRRRVQPPDRPLRHRRRRGGRSAAARRRGPCPSSSRPAGPPRAGPAAARGSARPAGRRGPRPGSTARQGARKAHHAQCVHDGVGSNETAGSSIARTAAPRRAAALRFSVVVYGTTVRRSSPSSRSSVWWTPTTGEWSSICSHAQHAVSSRSSRASSSGWAKSSTTRWSPIQNRSSWSSTSTRRMRSW